MVAMTNKDRINLLLKDNDKLINFLLESPCEHCFYWQDNHCNSSKINVDMENLCVDGIEKWLKSEVTR